MVRVKLFSLDKFVSEISLSSTISGVLEFLKVNKPIVLLLTGFCGIGGAKSKKLLLRLGFDKYYRLRGVKEFVYLLEDDLQEYIVTIIGSAAQQVTSFRKYLSSLVHNFVKLGHTKGKRYVLGLPVNGQRTHTNAATARASANYLK